MLRRGSIFHSALASQLAFADREVASLRLFWVEMDIGFILIKDRMLCATFAQRFMDCSHFFILMKIADTQC